MIRHATRADLHRVAALELELFGGEAWDESALRAELTGPGRRFVVDATADELAGYAVSMSLGDIVDLHRVGVSPHRQRAGVAGALLADLLSHPGEADRMLLEVSATNHAAIAFYLAHGFTRIDVRTRYYRDGSDAWVMRRSLATDIDRSGRMQG